MPPAAGAAAGLRALRRSTTLPVMPVRCARTCRWAHTRGDTRPSPCSALRSRGLDALVEAVRFCAQSSWRPLPAGATAGAGAGAEGEGEGEGEVDGAESLEEGSDEEALTDAELEGAGEGAGGDVDGRAAPPRRRARAPQSEWLRLRSSLLRKAAAEAREEGAGRA